MTTIGFVRHGVTQWNKEGRAQGSSDIPLDEEGLSQARLLAYRLEASEWDVVYSSDLLRAKQTAEILNAKLGTQLNLDSRLRERGGGLTEGTTEEERIQRWGPNWRELDMQFESHDSIISRGNAFIDEISEKHVNQNVLIVSHGAFIKTLLKALCPGSNMDESLKNTSLTSLIKCGRSWNCELYNRTEHLLEGDSLKM
ncbi:histidine phosphatase family protein [Lentibacillus amyloliquefaciens]|uniref:Phosphoglycerate kinase n=1 Tax=Lentibacillus amyloliquefaciens TaxID=1472767 RepID=A0A0U4FFH5_9BACI|nr:histidine phosphatase family protein [Lentibacillus amyloliquefaciens]ALX49277.1 phosphoglycerate kinase [Lentibacillus amyloliquefaciens]